MYERAATWFVEALVLYAALGAVFALAFVSEGMHRIDPNTNRTGLVFRLLIFPGAAAFWPLLLTRWIRGDRDVPEERNPHR